jgi:hypothetical protein
VADGTAVARIGGTMSGMRTTEKLTVTVTRPVAEQARVYAQRRGESVSSLTDRALRDYLIRAAARTEPAVDEEWLEAVGSTIAQTER